MAYYVATKVNEKSYEAVNIKRCRQVFTTNYRYEEPCACTLKEINNITTTYTSEEEFKTALRREFILNKEQANRELVIFYADEVEKRIVKGTLLYEGSRELIESVPEVINYLLNKFKEKDYNFFRKLADTLNSDSISKSIIYQLSSTIEESLVNDKKEITDNEVITAIKLLIYENNINEKGIVSPTKKLDYESFHNIVSFIAEYEETIKKEKTSGYSRKKEI